MEFLDVKKDHWYIDCNLGGGGHTEEILKKGGKVIGIDLDPDAINEVAKNHQLTVENVNYHLQAFSENLILFQANFSDIDNVIAIARALLIASVSQGINARQSELPGQRIASSKTPRNEQAPAPSSRNDVEEKLKISGVFFDLGVSTYQLEKGSRGFSFNKGAPLDMRMNPEQGASAQDLVNGLYEKELSELFWKFGEENFAKPIARKIVEYRKTKFIETTDELAQIVLSVRRRNPNDRTHPATRIFQALRIVVNDELNSLTEALPKAFELLEPNGRLVVISFHSLEDRIVKNTFRDLEKEGKAKILTDKPLETSEEESTINPRSRSAKLRTLVKI
jgi:16S rRNA (cytosine1402-N4)-methyltransferase